MVGDEVLGALADPGEVTHAQLAAAAKRGRDLKPGRITQRGGRAGGSFRQLPRGSGEPQLLGARQVEAQQFAAVISHLVIIAIVDMTPQVSTTSMWG